MPSTPQPDLPSPCSRYTPARECIFAGAVVGVAISLIQVGPLATFKHAVFCRCCVRSGAHRRAQLGRDPFVEVIGGIQRNPARTPEDRPAANHGKFSQRAGGTTHALCSVEIFRGRVPAQKFTSTHNAHLSKRSPAIADRRRMHTAHALMFR
jgi:hypothetical protein